MTRTLHEIPNGDRWQLVLMDGQPMVLHRPNQASGGRASYATISGFLSASHHGPEHAELLRLIGALADPEVLEELDR